MGLRKFQGKFYIYIQMPSGPSFKQPKHSEVRKQVIRRKERCPGASPRDWRSRRALGRGGSNSSSPRGPGSWVPQGGKPVSAATLTLFLSPLLLLSASYLFHFYFLISYLLVNHRQQALECQPPHFLNLQELHRRDRLGRHASGHSDTGN